MVKRYYQLAKPGIVYGNLLTTLAAFLFASRWHFHLTLLVATLAGLGLVIGSACVFNNYIDRDIDRRMARTKARSLAAGTISARAALTYATVLGIAGLYLLAVFVNLLTAGIALFGFFWYVVIYSIGKRWSHWGTEIGSISGAVPIVVGYTAITGRIDLVAAVLFLILALWQLPHFYAIAVYRLDEYRAAGIPVLPAEKGIATTKRWIIASIIAFAIASAYLTGVGSAGYLYLAVMLALSAWWLAHALRGLGIPAVDDVRWARGLFRASLIVLLGFSAMLALAPHLSL